MSCNNPAPAFHPLNSTLFVSCRDGRNRNFPPYRTEDPFRGPWTKVMDLEFPPSWGDAKAGENKSPFLRNEDPYLYIDRRGNFHLLLHRYDYRDGYPVNPNQTMPILVSGHAFSTDGVDWHVNTEQQPYDPIVTFQNGTQQQFSTWERPHLLFDDDGIATHLVVAVSPYWNDDRPCDGCPKRVGSEHSCVVCKCYGGHDYTYTLVVALNVEPSDDKRRVIV